jgi:hypothetical protein
MKFDVKQFRSMELALSQILPRITAQELKTGKPVAQFGNLRPREILANWLFCAALNSRSGVEGVDLSFTTDPHDGDGIIYDQNNHSARHTEHVYVPPQDADQTSSVEELVAAAVALKVQKGPPYAKGKTLLVFVDAGGDRVWYSNKAARLVPKNDFVEVWAISRDKEATYECIYNVSLLIAEEPTPVFQVRINKKIPKWTVVRTQ